MGPRVFFPHGSLREGDDLVVLAPKTAGWTYCGLRVLELGAAGRRALATGTTEVAVLPLAGSFTVECEGRRFGLTGRDDVFSRVTDFAYAPIDAELVVGSSTGGRAALLTAEATRRLDPAYGPAEEVEVEVRGGGQASRQLNNFLAPHRFPADKLVGVELLTPAGNWSSFPPHKHDEAREGEAELEEIYYFELAARGGGVDRSGFAFHRLYTTDGEFDETETVRTGDVFCIPRGYHGPSVAMPGHHLYCLNVLAGPAQERSMTFCDDPDHAWLRDELPRQGHDPRLPLCTAAGPTGRAAG